MSPVPLFPGLAAKPIIDLDDLLASADYSLETSRRLASLGYEPDGDLGIIGREAFRTPPTLFAHHLYVCLPNCEEFRRHILLRDSLRSRSADVSAYSNLKWDWFAKFANDRCPYSRQSRLRHTVSATRDSAVLIYSGHASTRRFGDICGSGFEEVGIGISQGKSGR